MKRVVGYIRISKKDKDEKGLSLENQESKIYSYADTKDLEVSEIYKDDGKSAKNVKRDKLQEVLDGVKDGTVGHVIIYKIDRLTRSIKDLGMLLELFEKHGVALSAVVESLDTTSASGRMIVNMIGVIAQWERETISERTKSALAVKRKRGERLGRIPFGYKAKGIMLVKVPKEQDTLKTIMNLHESGKGYEEIARYLNKKKILTRSKRPWTRGNLRSIIRTCKVYREQSDV